MCNKNNRFRSTRNGSTYICENCGKRTRESGNDESSLLLCLACNLTAEIHNMISDNGHNFTDEQAKAFKDRVVAANADNNTIRKIHEEVMAIAYA